MDGGSSTAPTSAGQYFVDSVLVILLKIRVRRKSGKDLRPHRLPQSISLVAASVGVTIDKIEKGLEPFIAEKRHRMDHLTVEPGQTAGFSQKAVGFADGRPWYSAEFIGHADPLSAGFELKDSIDIEGCAPIHLAAAPDSIPT